MKNIRWHYYGVLFSLLFAVVSQSVHSFGHLQEFMEEVACKHEPTDSQHELTHQHHIEKPCPVCKLNLGTAFLLPDFEFAIPIHPNWENPIATIQNSHPIVFDGQHPALRAPPRLG